MRDIYLDNSATTRILPEVRDAMIRMMELDYGNPSSMHRKGMDAEQMIRQAREEIAATLKVDEKEITFTSGGTEANNWALKGIAHGNKHKGKHIIVSAIEHHSIIESANKLIDEGFEVDFAPVTNEGFVDVKELKKLLRPDTILVSVMAVNNEVGSIQPIKQIRDMLNKQTSKAYFHVDAVQALSTMKLDVKDMGVDLLTISSHKVHGPKGVGALYVKKGTKIASFMDGGEQERGLRGGTTNVPAIVGFGKAVLINEENKTKNVQILEKISNYFIDKVKQNIDYIKINSPSHDRSPQIVNISFDLIEGESILLWLNKNNVAVSTGSACASTSLDKSHVLTAMGMCHQLINGAVRFSFGTDITKEDVDYVVEKLVEIVKYLRTMSPLKEENVCITKK